jgi:hypothetical protein
MTVFIPGSDLGELDPGREGQLVQVSDQGYTLRVPESAWVRYFPTEERLHVELDTGQVLMVGVFENPDQLSARDWTGFNLLDDSKRGVNPMVPLVPVVEQERLRVADRPAESLVIAGPVSLYRRTVVATPERVFLFGHPGGEDGQETPFREILDSFEISPVEADNGFRSMDSLTDEDIPNLAVPYYSQLDPRWICDQIGTCYCYMGNCAAYTGIGDAGCYITGEAMIFDYYTGGYMNPQELDTCLTQNGGYTYWAGCGYGVCATSYNPLPACSPAVVSYAGVSSDLSLLDADLQAGYPVVAWVDWGSHYVVVIGKRDGMYQIHDPFFNRSEIYPGYIIHFVRYHGPLPGSFPAVDPDLEPGFPVQAYHSQGPPSGEAVQAAVLANLDTDSALEIGLSAQSQGPLYAWNADGSLLPGWPPVGDFGVAYPGATNLLGPSNSLEVVAGYTSGAVVAHDPSGEVRPGWPKELGSELLMPALADVNGDGRGEVFVHGLDRQLHAFQWDGSPLPGWPVSSATSWRFIPSIADLDGDGDLEILAASAPEGGVVDLIAYHHDGEVVDGFPLNYPGLNRTSPVVGDLDGDGDPEIVVPGSDSVLRVYTGDGVMKRTLAVTGTPVEGSALALADLDGDGSPEVVYQSDRALNIWRGDGSALPGWPDTWGEDYHPGRSSPVVGDVDGDLLPEVVITLSRIDSDGMGEVRVYDHDGGLHPAFPKTIRLGEGGVPALGDIDGDGRIEIVVPGFLGDAPSGFQDLLWVYDLGGDTHGQVEWGQFGGGSEHRGVYPVPRPTGPSPDPLPEGMHVFLPMVSRPLSPPEQGIHGRLLVDGEPGMGLPLALGVLGGPGWDGLAETVTGLDGSYSFSGLPDLESGQAYAIRYENPQANPDHVSEWTSRPISSYRAGGDVGVSETDLADLSLIGPQDGSSHPLPVTFAWQPRTVVPADLYSLALTDAETGELVFQSPPIRGSADYSLDTLPSGLEYGVPYRWTVWLYGPDGAISKPGAAHLVTFQASPE